jgi:catalase-peroxidase
MATATRTLGAEPEAGGSRNQGFGWLNPHMDGKASNAVTSGIEGRMDDQTRRKWDMGYFDCSSATSGS